MKRHTRGAGLISVITAFMILLILLVLFQKSLQISGSLLVKSEALRENTQEMVGNYYRSKQTAGQEGEPEVYTFSGIQGSFELRTRLSRCTMPDGTPGFAFFGDGGGSGSNGQEGDTE